MIDSILLVDDEDLFHLVFEDSCSLLDITLSLKSLNSADEAEKLFKKWFSEGSRDERPECVFVDLNIPFTSRFARSQLCQTAAAGSAAHTY